MSRILRLQTVKDAKRLYGVDETAFDSTCSCSNNCGPCSSNSNNFTCNVTISMV